MRRQPTFRQMVLLGLIMAATGWGGLVVLIIYSLPTLGSRWLLFFLLMLALNGTGLPFLALIHRRFPSKPLVDFNVIIRQTIWLSIYGNLLVWMQLGRVLDINRAFFLALSFVALEVLLRTLERSRWQPKDTDDEQTE